MIAELPLTFGNVNTSVRIWISPIPPEAYATHRSSGPTRPFLILIDFLRLATNEWRQVQDQSRIWNAPLSREIGSPGDACSHGPPFLYVLAPRLCRHSMLRSSAEYCELLPAPGVRRSRDTRVC